MATGMLSENPVRETTLAVLKRARNVKIRKRPIKELAASWAQRSLRLPAWRSDMHFSAPHDEEAMLDYLIILDSLNFCFWNPEGKRWQILYNGKLYDGYFALSLALKDFFEAYPDKANLKYFSNISFKKFRELLQGGKNLLLLKKRWEIVKKVSRHLVENYKASSKQFVLSGNRQFSILIPKIAAELFAFDDQAIYQESNVYLWKRAQILAVDICAALGGRGTYKFKDPGYPTTFPDYRIPQILEHLDIIEYSPKLKGLIKNRSLLPKASREEIEIRAATVWAIEYLKEALKRKGKELRSFEIDWLLWNESKLGKLRLPHHRTETWFY